MAFPKSAEWKNEEADPYLVSNSAIKKPQMGHSDSKSGMKTQNDKKATLNNKKPNSELMAALGAKPKGTFRGTK